VLCKIRREDKSDASRGEIKVAGIRKGEIELLGKHVYLGTGIVFLLNNFRGRLRFRFQFQFQFQNSRTIDEKTRLCTGLGKLVIDDVCA